MVTRSLLLLHIKHCLECREHHLQRMQEGKIDCGGSRI
jgi:hypothetical protein